MNELIISLDLIINNDKPELLNQWNNLLVELGISVDDEYISDSSMEIVKNFAKNNGIDELGESVKLYEYSQSEIGYRFKNWTHKNRIEDYLKKENLRYEFANGKNEVYISGFDAKTPQEVELEIKKLGVFISIFGLNESVSKEDINEGDYVRIKDGAGGKYNNFNAQVKVVMEDGVLVRLYSGQSQKYSFDDIEQKIEKFNESKQSVMDVAKEIYGSVEDAKKAFKEDYKSFYSEMSAQLEGDDVKLIDEIFNKGELNEYQNLSNKFTPDNSWKDLDSKDMDRFDELSNKNELNDSEKEELEKLKKKHKELNESQIIPQVDSSFWKDYRNQKSKLSQLDQSSVSSLKDTLLNALNDAWLDFVKLYGYNRDLFCDSFAQYVSELFSGRGDEFLYSDDRFKDSLKSIYGSKSSYENALKNIALSLIPKINANTITHTSFGEDMISLMLGSVSKTPLLENKKNIMSSYGKIKRANKSIFRDLKENKGLSLNEDEGLEILTDNVTSDVIAIFDKDSDSIVIPDSQKDQYGLEEISESISFKKIKSLFENKITRSKLNESEIQLLSENSCQLTPEMLSPEFFYWLIENCNIIGLDEFIENNSEKLNSGFNQQDLSLICTMCKNSGLDLDNLYLLYSNNTVEFIDGVQFIKNESLTTSGVNTEYIPSNPVEQLKLDSVDSVDFALNMQDDLNPYQKINCANDSIIITEKQPSVVDAEILADNFGIVGEDAQDIVEVLNDVYSEKIQKIIERQDPEGLFESKNKRSGKKTYTIEYDEEEESYSLYDNKGLLIDDGFEDKKSAETYANENGYGDLFESTNLKNPFEKFFKSFPDNASSWSQATEELKDMAREARMMILEFDNKNIETLDFSSFKTPSDWNKESKKFITETYSKMSEYCKKNYVEYFFHWLGESETKTKFKVLKKLMESKGLDGYSEIVKLHESVDAPIQTYADMVVYNADGKVLLLQRNPECDFEPNKWGFPGGKVQLGEVTQDGAVRECLEECGVECDAVEKVTELSNPDGSVSHYYKCLAKNEPILGDEHQNHSWVNPNEIVNYDLLMNNHERFDAIVNDKLESLNETQKLWESNNNVSELSDDDLEDELRELGFGDVSPKSQKRYKELHDEFEKRVSNKSNKNLNESKILPEKLKDFIDDMGFDIEEDINEENAEKHWSSIRESLVDNYDYNDKEIKAIRKDLSEAKDVDGSKEAKEGRKAFKDGLYQRDNPYKSGQEKKDWDAGWTYAMQLFGVNSGKK